MLVKLKANSTFQEQELNDLVYYLKHIFSYCLWCQIIGITSRASDSISK